MGGANCEGTMGLELSRSFPWIDYIFSGEADHSFPELVRRLIAGAAARRRRRADPPREDGASSHGRAAGQGPRSRRAAGSGLLATISDELRAGPLSRRISPSLLIESARGCWWGAKQHCTFCGLNGETMTFRAKSAPRVLAELERQMRALRHHAFPGGRQHHLPRLLQDAPADAEGTTARGEPVLRGEVESEARSGDAAEARRVSSRSSRASRA